jgi:hypothetical protein
MFKKFLLLPLLVLGIVPIHAQTSFFNFQLFDVPNSASTEADRSMPVEILLVSSLIRQPDSTASFTAREHKFAGHLACNQWLAEN